MLLVLSDPGDPVVDRVSVELHRRGARFAVLNPAAESVAPTLRVAFGERGARIRTPGGDLELDAIDRVWLWRPGVRAEDRAKATARFGDATVASYVEAEWATVVADALLARPRRWTPGTASAIRAADGKLGQLARARALGFQVPDTLVTNDPDEALAFLAAHDGVVINKAPSTVLTSQLMSKALVAYTRALEPRDVATIDAIGHVPVMLQRRIAKKLELRVTVVGDRVFPAAIHSQVTRRTRVDWRRYDHAHTPVLAHALPDEVSARCLALAHGLGLRYGAIDLIVTPEDEHVFVEINPNGQWTWIEDYAGLPITAALCDELLREGAP